MAALLAGCASTRGLSTEATLSAANGLAAANLIAATPTSRPRRGRATNGGPRFDPQLDALIDEALAGSPTLRVAQARTRKALASAATAKAILYPQVNGDLEVSREQPPSTA